jgi:hypothetical protein
MRQYSTLTYHVTQRKRMARKRNRRAERRARIAYKHGYLVKALSPARDDMEVPSRGS